MQKADHYGERAGDQCRHTQGWLGYQSEGLLMSPQRSEHDDCPRGECLWL